jgi:hypothetical protein
MTDFEILEQCILSGQLSARQIAEEMKDVQFAKWYEQGARGRNQSATIPDGE